MRTIIISEREKGLLFRNGRFVGVCGAGKYRLHGGRHMEVSPIEAAVQTPMAAPSTLLGDKAFSDETVTVTVPDGCIALCFLDGRFMQILPRSLHPYIFWKAAGEHIFQIIDITEPEVGEEIPRGLFSSVPTSYFTKIEVPDGCRGRLTVDHCPTRLLTPGTYYFWKGPKAVACDIVDTRLVSLELSGQEVLTRDKVTLRLNFICHYRVTDCERVFTVADDYREHLRAAARLALRAYVAAHTLDEILGDKEALSQFTFSRLSEKARDLCTEVTDADVKDIILPGEIRDIMNTVLVAEKQAQANVITRREEVASTRSLLNTAKLMKENPTLYKLKELEAIERICENVGSISLSGNGDILAQLAGMLTRRA